MIQSCPQYYNGTVIISHGKLTGGSLLTQELAVKHNKPCIHLDINKAKNINAIESLNAWIIKNKIEILNVAGPRASKDKDIYKVTKDILEDDISLYELEDGCFCVPIDRLKELKKRRSED